MDRRDFLKSTAAATGAAVIGGTAGDARALEDRATQIRTYNTLGKTGIKVSDVSFGAGKLNASSLAERAFDKGINYFDTAPDYGPSEEALGGFLEKRKADRDKIYITTKLCEPVPYPGHHPVGTPAKKIIEDFNGSLKRLKTDYVDFVFLHALAERNEDQRRLNDPELQKAMEKIKEQGKARFIGFSSHGPNNMENLVEQAVDTGRFDIMMVAFNFNKFPNLLPVIKKAHRNGMGVMCMKTLAGAKHVDLDRFKKDGAMFEQAALRWTLSHPEISGAVITINNVTKLRNYVAVSGSKFTKADNDMLDYYAKTFGSEVCRIGCGECLPHCATGVNIAGILRYNMYYENYDNQQDMAMRAYNRLAVKADACQSCTDAACEKGCPFSLPVREQLARAHRNLSIT